jgi:hypothetical protein
MTRFLTKWVPVTLDKSNHYRPSSGGLDHNGALIEQVLNEDQRLKDYDYKQAFWMEGGLLVIFQRREV